MILKPGGKGFQRRLDLAVADLTKLGCEVFLKWYLGAGEIVVEHMYAGDIERYRRRGPKDTTLKQLADHPGLPDKAQKDLYVAVRIYELYLRLGDVPASYPFDYSHYEAVLPAPPAEQPRLLVLSAQHKWGIRVLREKVAAVVTKRHGGPKPSGPVHKDVSGIGRHVEALKEHLASGSPIDDAEAHRIDLYARGLLAILAGRQAAAAEAAAVRAEAVEPAASTEAEPRSTPAVVSPPAASTEVARPAPPITPKKERAPSLPAPTPARIAKAERDVRGGGVQYL